MPLYAQMPYTELSTWLICIRASFGDGVIIALMWAAGALLFRSRRWFLDRRLKTIAMLLLSGATIAIAIEVHALAVGRWSYSVLMATLPPLGIGLSPLLQLLILPYAVLRIAEKRWP